ncbi:hypothetical protein [Murinocardiopsis flavida]|nr:hypothetical protein [Murinocardiopsis flavida]
MTMRTITGYAAAAALAGLLMTGCATLGIGGADSGGDSGKGGGAVGGRDAGSETQDAMLKFTECMRDNGVDMPDPKGGEGMMPAVPLKSSGKDKEAMDKCEKHLPVDENPPSDEEMHESNLKVAECLRSEGIDVEDPKMGEGLGLPIDDAEKMREPMRKCAEKGGPGGAGVTIQKGQ